MPKYEDSNEKTNQLTHSKRGGLYMPSMRIPGMSCRSTQEKNIVSRFGDNDYIAYHAKGGNSLRARNIFQSHKGPQWVEAMNEEMQALSKNKT